MIITSLINVMAQPMTELQRSVLYFINSGVITSAKNVTPRACARGAHLVANCCGEESVTYVIAVAY